jgi:predicted GIY-YIG superfamily endonuclease
MKITGYTEKNPWKDPSLIADGFRNHFVYWVYDDQGAVIYVGCTRNPKGRWQNHKYAKLEMVAEAYYCRMAGPYDFRTARRIEKEQRHKHNPRHDGYYNATAAS